MDSSATPFSQTSNPPPQRLCSMRKREEKPRSPRLRLRKKINHKEQNIEASRNVQKHTAHNCSSGTRLSAFCIRMDTGKAPAQLRCSIKPQRVQLQVNKYHNWQRWVQMSYLGLLESPWPRELDYGALRVIGGNRIARVAGFRRRRRRRTPRKLLSKPSSLPSRLRSRPLRSPPVPITFPMPAQLHTRAPPPFPTCILTQVLYPFSGGPVDVPTTFP